MDKNLVASVDIGTTKVVMAVAKKVKSKIEIVALRESPSEGVIKGDVRNLDLASHAISLVKEQVEKDLSTNIRSVSVGLSGQHISCTNKVRDISIGDGSGLSEITEEDLERLSRDTLNLSNSRERHVISILPQSYKIDSEEGILKPVGMEGGRLEGTFSVIEGEAAAIDRVRRCFLRSELNVGKIILQPLASADAVLTDDEKELGVAVVDIGGGTTDLCIYSDKIIRYVSVLAVGGTNINADIKSIGILERQVEKLKTKFGEAVASETNNDVIGLPSVNHQQQREIAKRDLSQIIESRMLDIVEWVKAQIEQTMHDKKLSAGIVLTGGGANLKNIELLFTRELKCPVRVARPEVHLSESCIQLYSDPKYATIIGMLWEELKNQEEVKKSSPVDDRGKGKTPKGNVRTSVEEEEEIPTDEDEGGYDDQYAEGDFTERPKEGWFKRLINKMTVGSEEL